MLIIVYRPTPIRHRLWISSRQPEKQAAWLSTAAHEAGILPQTTWRVDREPDRFRAAASDYSTNMSTLDKIYRLLLKHQPSPPRLTVTVSPAPLDLTFNGEDAAVAKAYSKAVLRAVAVDFCVRTPTQRPFLSFEIITFSGRTKACVSDDLGHVRDDAVGVVTSKFLAGYLGEVGRPPEFNEAKYLAATAAIDVLVRAGVLESSFEGWVGKQASTGSP